MENPFIVGFSTEAQLKAGMDNDGAISAENDKPLDENPFVTGPNRSNPPKEFQNPFITNFVKSEIDAPQPGPLPGQAGAYTHAAKQLTGLAGEAVNFVGQVPPMAASYIAYAIERAKGKSAEEAHKTLEQVREINPEKGFEAIAQKAGFDKSWLQHEGFRNFMQEFDEKWVKPGSDKYTGEKPSLEKTMYEDFVNMFSFGAAAGGAHVAKGKLTAKPAEPTSSGIEAANLRNRVQPAEPPVTQDTVGPAPLPSLENAPPTLPERPSPIPAAEREVTYPNIDEVKQPSTDVPALDTPLPKVEEMYDYLPNVFDKYKAGLKPETPEVGDTREPVNKSQYPIIMDEPKPFMDQLGPDVDTSGKMHNPFLTNVLDQENAQHGPDIGAHSEMKMQVEPQDPISGPDATHAYDSGIRSDVENKNFHPNLAENYPNHHHDAVNGIIDKAESKFVSGDDLWKETHFREGLENAKTTGHALDLVSRFSKDKEQQHLARHLTKFVKDIPFEVSTNLPRGTHGGHLTSADGSRRIVVGHVIRGLQDSVDGLGVHGMTAETILHEAMHAATSPAIKVGRNEVLGARPEYAKHREFASTIESLRLKVADLLDPATAKLAEEAMVNADEFLTYGLTNTKFQELLSHVRIPDTNLTALQRFANSVKRFLGIDRDAGSSSALDRLLSIPISLDEIQNVNPKHLSRAVQHIMNQRESEYQRSEDWMKQPTLKDIDPDWTAFEALIRAEGKDISQAIPHNMITPNQIAQMSGHPVMGWFMAKMGQIFRQAAPRFHRYADTLQPYMFGKDKLSRDDTIKAFKTLVDIQDPALRDLRKDAEDRGARAEFLQQAGLSGRPLQFAVDVLDIMQSVHKSDIASAKRLGRELNYEPMYFPRVHGGRFLLKVFDEHGVEQYVKGFDSYKEAREKESELRNALKDKPELRVENVTRAERQTFGDDFTMMLLENEIPLDFLEKGVRGIEKTRETAPFAFEKNRRDTNVGGYVGEDITGKPEQERLLKALSWRLQASRNFEQKSRMLTEIKFPLFDTAALGEMPRLRSLVGQLVNRELGVDISGVKGVDKWMEKGAEGTANALKALAHFEEKYIRGKDVSDFRWDDPKTSHDLAKEIIRQWTYAVSFVKLGLNPPVLVSNFASNLLIGLYGIRSASLEGINPAYALTASLRTLAYTGLNKEAKAFMQEARNEGMIETKGHEHYTTAELPERNAFDRTVQYPRDKIEEFTNYTGTLFYYHMFKHARPDLTGEALKAKVYQHAKTFTGQYDSFAGPLMFDRAGTPGQLFTNFSKWHFNQLGILLTDMKAAGVDRNVVPLLTTIGTVALAGGVYGLPAVVEYETIRRLGMAFQLWDLAPVSALREKVQDHIPYWQLFERGAITSGADALARKLGASSGPDVSGSMRYSAFLDTPTVAIQTFWDAVTKMIPTGYRELKALMGTGPGSSPKQLEDAFGALPPAIKGLMKNWYSSNNGFFKEKVVGKDGKTMWRIKDPSNMGQQMYTISDIEETYNLLNMTGVKEQKNKEAIYYDKYLERENTKEITEQTQGILAHIGDGRVYRHNLLKLIELGGEGAVNGVMMQIQQRVTASQYDYFVSQYRKLSNETDGIQAKRRFERLTKSKSLVE